MLRRLLVFAMLLLAAFAAPAYADGGATPLAGDTQVYSLLVGVFAPPLLAVIMQPTWSERRRTAVMLAASALLGLGVSWLTGELDSAKNTSSAVVGVLVTASATFQQWKKSGISPAIEAATSRTPATVTETVVTEPEATPAPRKPRRRAPRDGGSLRVHVALMAAVSIGTFFVTLAVLA